MSHVTSIMLKKTGHKTIAVLISYLIVYNVVLWWEYHKTQAFENKVLKKIFRQKREREREKKINNLATVMDNLSVCTSYKREI
jgi:hypothetical protein